jgi:hypothetical protein
MPGATKRFSRALKIYAAGIAVIVVLAILRAYGLSVVDVARLARAKVTEAAVDAKALMSREYSDRYSQKLREEAMNMPAQATLTNDNEDPELARDLTAERKRILEERAEYLEKNAVKILTGDKETLKKQVEEQVRQAGGKY